MRKKATELKLCPQCTGKGYLSCKKEEIEKMEPHTLIANASNKKIYPEYLQEFVKHQRGGASYTLAIANFTSNNALTLEMRYDVHDSDINVNITCEKMDSEIRNTNIYGLLVYQYILENQCMEKGLTKSGVEAGTMSLNDEEWLD